MRGYIAMLATRQEYRGQGIASKLVGMAVEKMIAKDADEVCPSIFRIHSQCANSDIRADRTGNRNRQHPITTNLRELGLFADQTFAPVLLEREHGIQTNIVSQAGDTVQAYVPARNVPRGRFYESVWANV